MLKVACFFALFISPILGDECSEDLEDILMDVPKPEPSIDESILNQDTTKGIPTLPGYYPFLVLFIKKLDESPKTKKEFRSDQFLCAGTILNRKWVLTRANPIGYYPVDGYFMIARQRIQLPFQKSDKVINVDYVAIHPDYSGVLGDETDLAMVRSSTAMNFTFQLRSANFPYNPNTVSLENCKLLIWSLNRTQLDANLIRAEMRFNVNKGPSGRTIRDTLEGSTGEQDQITTEMPNTTGETTPDPLQHIKNTNANPMKEKEYFYELSANETYLPCFLNSGAPLVCDSVFVGVYTGSDGKANCDVPQESFGAIRLARTEEDSTLRWIKSLASGSVKDAEKYRAQDFDNQFKACS